jgi:hypothetical protein
VRAFEKEVKSGNYTIGEFGDFVSSNMTDPNN